MRDTIFRLFLSSTFADFQHERRVLHERVFPALDEHARANGARFEVVDLRWGISREAQEDQRTLAICLGEIDRCRRIGLPPNFAVLLGDRYGWEPPPVEIAGADWLRIMSAAGADIHLLNTSYAPDRNAVPVLWRLRPDVAREGGADVKTALVAALRRAAVAAGLAPGEHPGIFASVTHQEVLRGALSLPTGTGDVFAYVREIEGLPFSAKGAPYVDVAGDAWDVSAHERLETLKHELRGHLAPGQFRRFVARWHGGDIATDHLDAFCARFLADQKALIDRSLFCNGKSGAASSISGLHATFARDRARLFVGREAELMHTTAYAASAGSEDEGDSGGQPLIIVGDGGTGKSALLAECARRVSVANDQAIVLARFVGAVPGSESLAGLLGELAQAIATGYGHTTSAATTDFDVASAGFQRALGLATADRPLVLFIDALDQLDAADQLRLLDWLPDKLPAPSRLIATTRDGRMAAEARRRFQEGVMQLAPMPTSDSAAMLDRLLADAGRTLTGNQRAAIARASPGLPLWTRLAFEEARRWHSDDAGCVLEESVEGLILARIAELSTPAAHGQSLVADALAAIAASRFGLSDSEMAEALSQANAPAVWAEFRARSFHPWDEPQLPPILWFRLHADLAPYLGEQRVDGTLTYRFFHREFQEVVARQFLEGKGGADMHRRLAVVFNKPASHGFHVACDVTHPQEPRALRRIMEQPWQIAAAGDHDALAALIDDVGFVAAKCAANRVGDLMQDIAAMSHAGEPARTSEAWGAWCARLLAWRPMLAQGDARWPAHRILFQLLLEADDVVPQRAQALDILQRNPPDWTVLVNTARQHYSAPLLVMVAAPPRLAGMAPLSSRIIAAWDTLGSLQLIDRTTGAMLERVELGRPDKVADLLATFARTLGLSESPPVFAAPDARDRRRLVSHALAEPALKLSWQWGGCLVVECDKRRTEIILGKDDILFLGETEGELFFLADGHIAVASKQRLANLGAGLFSANGQRIDGLAIDGDEGGWTHERFNSVVFIDADTCLTFGFSLGGAQRDDVILEIYRITQAGVRRRAYGITDHDLDLPIWHVAGLSNGSVVFASERYWHTFEWAPPFEGECEVTMVTGAMAGRGDLGSWVDTGNAEGHLTFDPTDPAIRVTFDAPGFYGSMGGECFAPDGITRLDPDDFAHSGADFTGIEIEDEAGRITRWLTDVRPHWIFERERRDFIVFKNSGPVRVVISKAVSSAEEQ